MLASIQLQAETQRGSTPPHGRVNADDRILQCCLQWRNQLQVGPCGQIGSARTVFVLALRCCDAGLIFQRLDFTHRTHFCFCCTVRQEKNTPASHTDAVILLSNDNLLRIKAHSAGILAFSTDALSPRWAQPRGCHIVKLTQVSSHHSDAISSKITSMMRI